jgi:hypothetical protein
VSGSLRPFRRCLCGPGRAEQGRTTHFPLVAAAHRSRIIIDDIGYVHSRATRRPAPPPPAPRPPGPVRHPLRDLPHLRPGRVPLPGRGEARPPSLCELSGVGRHHRRVLRAAGPGPAGSDRRGRVAGAPGAAAGAGRAESPAALGVATRSFHGPTASAEGRCSDARSSSVAWYQGTSGGTSSCFRGEGSSAPHECNAVSGSMRARVADTWTCQWSPRPIGSHEVRRSGTKRRRAWVQYS